MAHTFSPCIRSKATTAAQTIVRGHRLQSVGLPLRKVSLTAIVLLINLHCYPNENGGYAGPGSGPGYVEPVNNSFHRQFPASVVRIHVEAQRVLHVISKDFLGFGYEKSAVAQEGFFSANNAHLIQLYRTLSSHGLVRIGGNVSDHTRFVPNGVRLVRTEKETSIINQRALDEFADFLRRTGWQAMWGLNLGTGTKEAAAQEALAVSETLGDRLQSFEIGNEVDLLPRFKNFEAYYKAFREYKAAIRKAVPGAAFSGPDVAGQVAWAVDFAGRESRDMKLLTRHYYRTGAKRPEATIRTLLAPDSKWEETLNELQRTSQANNISFRVNEVNSFYGGGKPGVSDTFAAALWCLDYMFRLAAHGCNGANLETDINQLGWVSHYSPIFRDKQDQLTVRPEYYGMLAFSFVGRGELVKVVSSARGLNLCAYATRTPEGKLWVTVVNKELEGGTTVEIALPRGDLTAEAYRLIAPSVESRAQVTLGGTEVTSRGTWSPGVPEKLPVRDGVATLPLAAASAALVQIH